MIIYIILHRYVCVCICVYRCIYIYICALKVWSTALTCIVVFQFLFVSICDEQLWEETQRREHILGSMTVTSHLQWIGSRTVSSWLDSIPKCAYFILFVLSFTFGTESISLCQETMDLLAVKERRLVVPMIVPSMQKSAFSLLLWGCPQLSTILLNSMFFFVYVCSFLRSFQEGRHQSDPSQGIFVCPLYTVYLYDLYINYVYMLYIKYISLR